MFRVHLFGIPNRFRVWRDSIRSQFGSLTAIFTITICAIVSTMTSCYSLFIGFVAQVFIFFVCECGASAVYDKCQKDFSQSLPSKQHLFELRLIACSIHFLLCWKLLNSWMSGPPDARRSQNDSLQWRFVAAVVVTTATFCVIFCFFFFTKIEFDSTKLKALSLFGAVVKDRFPRNYCNFQFRFFFFLSSSAVRIRALCVRGCEGMEGKSTIN